MSGDGYRGYVFSRPVLGNRAPQHVQNLVIRDYAARRGLLYKLSATEYAMPGCYLVLEQVLDALDGVQGVILYTLFMLPEDREYRLGIYDRVLGAGRQLHSAVEGFRLEGAEDIGRWESLLVTADICNALGYEEIEPWLTSTS